MARPPKLVPPFRFSVVEVGVYRGAYPTLKNFAFLKILGLKTVISLCPVCYKIILKQVLRLATILTKFKQEKPTMDLEDFCFTEGAELLHFMGDFVMRDDQENNRILTVRNPITCRS